VGDATRIITRGDHPVKTTSWNRMEVGDEIESATTSFKPRKYQRNSTRLAISDGPRTSFSKSSARMACPFVKAP